ncbi:MAG TPA: T9SS type A sorting domain-containing protein [Bacteroidales bacterium]|nr:T9SS type A sorting domain-containing protein [Bacteroidales bacterium]HSA43116.1 T9SS type A sorting domain-containing protein [Bacteroidales bacterium]
MNKSIFRKNNGIKAFMLLLAFCLVQGAPLRAQITITKTDATCGKKDGTASASVNHGTPPYTFKWSNGANGASISGLGPGTYTVSVTDANNCKGDKSVTIVAKKGSLVVTMGSGGEVPFCVQDGPPVITLSASVSGGTPPYHWAPAQSINVSGSGKYSIGVTDSNNCFGKASAVFTFIPIVCSRDPNEIVGPAGYGDPKYVSSKKPLDYLINFENDPEFATAPAQRVLVTYKLDPHMNLSSVKLGEFGFGNLLFTVPPNTSFYSNRLDVRDSLGLFVDVTAGINVGEGTVFWIFQSIDPATGLPPEDPMLGFLPINDSVTHKGEGMVTFSIRPKSDVITGDSLKAAAEIVFDINPPLATNTWVNIADAVAPQSQVVSLPAESDTTTVAVYATGSDDSGGSGIASFELYVSENNGPFLKSGEAPWGEAVIFSGNPCTSYAFYSIATDNAGNRESAKNTAEAAVILSPAPAMIIQPLSQQVPLGTAAVFSVEATNAVFYQWETSTDGGAGFTPLSSNPPYSGTTTSTLTIDPLSPDLSGLVFRCLVSNGGCFTYSEPATLLVIASLSGSLKYDNLLQSPVSASRIILYDMEMDPVDTAITNQSGAYLFSNIAPGTYLVRPDIDKTWGGVNATDALLVLRHFVNLDTLEGLHFLAGDVNNSQQINAIDALLIARRFVLAINSFPAGDWISRQDTVDLGTTSRVVSFLTLCYGDVDASYVPGLKTRPAVNLLPGPELHISSGEAFSLPLTLTSDILAGAVSLVLEYPAAYLDLTDISTKNPRMTEDLMHAVYLGEIRIAWYSHIPMAFEQGEALLNLHFRAKDRSLDGKLAFQATAGSEVAGKDGIPYSDLQLLIPALTSSDQPEGIFLGQNYPNPFMQNTTIGFYLPFEARIDISLYNYLGQAVRQLVSGVYTEGHHQISFDASALAPGIYPYRMTVFEGENLITRFHLLTVGH